MTWLSQSIDLARKLAGSNRVWAVAQAFGGYKWKDAGWPRMPDQAEILNLSFPALVHGAKGVFFYSHKNVKDPLHWEAIKATLIRNKTQFSLY